MRGNASLVPKASAEAIGCVRLRIDFREGDHLTNMWSGVIGSIRGRPTCRSVEIDTALPKHRAAEGDLILSANPVRGVSAGVDRIRWNNLSVIEQQLQTTQTVARSSAKSDARPSGDSIPTAMGTLCREGERPLISLLTPVHDPDPAILIETLASVRRQTFGDWELCIADDGSNNPRVIAILNEAAEQDSRIRIARNEQAGGISRATNTALGIATGQYIALLDHDDVLADDALEAVATEIGRAPGVDMLYTDEDVFDDERIIAAFLKPSWSPDLMRSQMYTCHLSIYRRSLALEVGGFRPEFDGSQDYDFALRISERTDRIVHIPRVLYHWRSHEKSVAGDIEAKLYAFSAARRAITEHLERTGIDGKVNFGGKRGIYRMVYTPDRADSVSMILPVTNANQSFLRELHAASRSWLAGEYDAWDLTVVGSSDAIDACADVLPTSLRDKRLRAVQTEPALDRSAMFNFAAQSANADFLVLLEGPWQALSRDWLSCLVGFASRSDVGAVGAKTVAPDGRVEHGGVVLWDGLPLPLGHGTTHGDSGPMYLLEVAANLCAVSGTMATRQENFDLLGGLDSNFTALAEVDFCLRALERGFRIVTAPDALLRRANNSPAVNDTRELAVFSGRWRARVGDDTYFSSDARALLTGLAPTLNA